MKRRPPPVQEDLVRLEGRTAHIAFQDPESHYTVARLRPTGGGNVTVVGHLVGLRAGDAVRLWGRWERHPRFGRQFQVARFEVPLPADAEGIRDYLSGGVVPGIGPAMAARLVAAFGAGTLEVIERRPERLAEVAGIGPQRAAAIAEAWSEHHTLHALMRFLQEHGVSPAHTAPIHRLYGAEAEAVLRESPFRLAEDLPGAGFPVADTLARHLGRPADEPQRLAAGLGFLVSQAVSEGHVWCSRNRLLSAAEERFAIDRTATEAALAERLAEGMLVEEPIPDEPDDSAIYPADLFRAEKAIARRLTARLSVPRAAPALDPEEIAARVFGALGIAPSAEQIEVLEASLRQPLAIVTGGPGTGKTTLIRAYTALLAATGRRVLLAAPTGRAARRLAEVSGRPAATVHRLLGFNPSDGGFFHHADHPLDTDALVVDEASMLDTALTHHLLEAVPMSASLLLVGDASQLPSVGPGNVLADLLASGCLPAYTLSAIFRQAAASPIVVNAHRIRRGEMPAIDGDDGPEAEFTFLEVPDPPAAAAAVVDLCRSLPGRLELADPLRDVQVLTPMHKGEAGTLHLNPVLQKALNSGPAAVDGRFRPGDKVMHLRNNYAKDVFNGDIGTVAAVDGESGRLTVDFEGRRLEYAPEEQDELTLAYAITVHKSQGSEYPVVIVPLLTQHYPLLQRNLLYTAVTRGRRRVVLVGTRKALAIAVHNDRPTRRLTGLCHRLQRAPGSARPSNRR